MSTFWDKRTIKAKLLLGIGAILALFAVVLGVVLMYVNGLAGSANLALGHIVPMRELAVVTQLRMVEADDAAAYYLIDRSASNGPAYIKTYDADIAAVKAALPTLLDAAETSRDRETIAALQTWLGAYLAGNEHAFELKRSGKYDAAAKAFVDEPTTTGTTLLADFAAARKAGVELATAQVESRARTAIIVSICGAVAAILAGITIAFALGGSIAKRLQVVTQAIEQALREDFASLTGAMRQFAAGDLSARVTSTRTALPVRGSDETALLTQSYNNLVDGITAFGVELSATGNALEAIIGEVRTTVDAAAVGDFTQRLDVRDQRGAFKALAENLNRLMDVSSVGLNEVVRVLDALAKGDLTQTITNEYTGTFGQLKNDSNQVVNALHAIIADVKGTVDAAAHGDFTTRLDTAQQRGAFKDVAENLNRLMDVSSAGLNEVVRVLGALAKGDLTQTISNHYEGTFGRLKDDSNATVASLTRTVSVIKEAAEVVSTSAREIASGNGDLSQRTEEQAASLEETAASMEELTATVHQNAENAKEANMLAIGASKIAIKGGEVVGEVVQTMAAINESGKKIVDIISVIDGIAFQTNILALNAAVEAARAGEQGRGFAVVAGEVRTLAQRSAAAAKEIKSLIGDSVEKTNNGTRLVGHAGETMAEIVESVKRVTDIMSAIAAASLQQGSGIGQVNDAVTQMDRVTQQNATLVEEIAASAMALEERADGLVEAVNVFTLADEDGRPLRKPAAMPVAAHAAAKSAKANRPTARGSTRTATRPPVGLAEPTEDGWNSF